MKEFKGYYIVARKTLESEIWHKPPLYWKVWSYLLAKACWDDFGNIKRGQLFVSIKEIQEDNHWYVGFKKMIPSKSQIFDILEWLRTSYEGSYETYNEPNNEGNSKQPMIATTKTTRGMLISIVKYDVYQDVSYYTGNTESNNEDFTKATPNNLRRQQQANTKKETNKTLNTNKTIKDKKEYGELSNVLLSDEEYLKLKEKNLLSYIDDLSLYIPNKKGKPYVNHYATILQWSRKDEKEKSRNNKELPAWYQDQSNIDTGVEDFDESELQEKIKRLRGEDTINDNVR